MARRSTTADWATGTNEQIAKAKGDPSGGEDDRTRQQRGRDELDYERDRRGRQKGGGGARRRSSPADRVGAVRLPGSGGVTVDDGAGLILGLLAYAVVLQWFRGGPTQVKKYLRAKFVNKVG